MTDRVLYERVKAVELREGDEVLIAGSPGRVTENRPHVGAFTETRWIAMEGGKGAELMPQSEVWRVAGRPDEGAADAMVQAAAKESKVAYGTLLCDFAQRIEDDRREPDKLLCHAQSMRGKAARLPEQPDEDPREVTDAMIEKGAAKIEDLLEQLGVDPRDRGSDDVGDDVKTILSRAVLRAALGAVAAPLPDEGKDDDDCRTNLTLGAGIVEDWMEIKIVVPGSEGSLLLPKIRVETGLAQIDEDWTVEKRDRDNATMEFNPCPPPPDRKAAW